jgi:hypothetical protein
VFILRIAKLFQGKNHLVNHIKGISQAKGTFIVLHNERNILEYKWAKGPIKT